jgi:hypothetical protein
VQANSQGHHSISLQVPWPQLQGQFIEGRDHTTFDSPLVSSALHTPGLISHIIPLCSHQQLSHVIGCLMATASSKPIFNVTNRLPVKDTRVPGHLRAACAGITISAMVDTISAHLRPGSFHFSGLQLISKCQRAVSPDV